MKQETTKLRNKDTGIIREARIASGHLQLWEPSLEDWVDYDDLDDLARFWEYYEEPKEWWYINIDGGVKKGKDDFPEPVLEDMKKLGNYFLTQEKAEKSAGTLKSLIELASMTGSEE